MRTFFALASLWACLVSTVAATALTYKLEAHEKACFFTNVERTGIKVAFYFAVCEARPGRWPLGTLFSGLTQRKGSEIADTR
jgi:hypothetical protein